MRRPKYRSFFYLLVCWLVASFGSNATATTKTTEVTRQPPPDTQAEAQGAEPSLPGNRILILAPSAASNVEQGVLTELASILAVETAAAGPFEVVSTRYVTQMLKVESTADELGCATETCLGEIADALNADFVVHSKLELGNLKKTLRVVLFDSRKHMNRNSILIQVEDGEAFTDEIAKEYPKLFTEVLAERVDEESGTAESGTAPAEELAPANDAIPLPSATTERRVDQSRVALVSVGGLLGAAGAGSILVGLWPFAKYMMAREQAFQAIGARTKGDYENAIVQSKMARDDDEVWGRATWIAGGVALGVGVLMLSAGVRTEDGEAVP